MRAIVNGPGEGEALFGGRIVLKSALDHLTVTESWFPTARPGAGPHLHREHTDSFYVLEGRLAFLLHHEEHVVGPGACVSVPPGVVHGFRSLSPARFLNLHTPDGGFADHLRALDRGDPGGFDSVDAAPGSGADPAGAVVLHAGEGERLTANRRTATLAVGRPELCLTEFELEPDFEGPSPHAHDDHVDAFYVLSGRLVVHLDDRSVLAAPGAFVAVPPGVHHGFTSGPAGARMLNVHAPGAGFHDRLRVAS